MTKELQFKTQEWITTERCELVWKRIKLRLNGFANCRFDGLQSVWA